jgi:putative DNA primase/helicase
MILELPLPEKEAEHGMPNYTPVLEEEDRGEVTEGLREYWDAKLYNLCQEIRNRPFPGEIYDLKSHAVFGLARGAPHIISEDRIRNMVRAALDARYRKHGDPPEAAVWRKESYDQVDQAIADGLGVPWYPPKIDDVETHPLTEYGLAERLLDQYAEDLVHEPSWANWLVWNGKFWNLEAGRALVQEKHKATTRTVALEAQAYYHDCWIARQEFERVSEDPNIESEVKEAATRKFKALDKRINDIFSFALKSETRGKTNAAIDLASSDPRVLISHHRLNKNPYLLNFSNGVVDLRTGQPHAHRREDYITRMVPHDFDPTATCPAFDNFLLECMAGRPRLVNFLWRLLGYTSIGVTTEQIIVILVGDGANGKTTFSNTILEAFGEGEGGYGFAANSENLLTTKGMSRHETYRMSLFGKRFVPCQEVEEGRSFAESLIKELCGSDHITGRKMRQDEWTYLPEHQVWLSVNHLPMVRGTDEGIWRRLIVIPWDISFKGREDVKLPEKLKLEIPGIWARIAREAVAWQQEGLPIPPEVQAATDEYRREQDPLEPFFELWCVVGADSEDFAARDLLWAAYLQYAEYSNNRAFHQKKTFFAALKKRFREGQNRQGKRGFRGLRLMTPKERVDALPQSKLNAAQEQEDKKKKYNEN